MPNTSEQIYRQCARVARYYLTASTLGFAAATALFISGHFQYGLVLLIGTSAFLLLSRRHWSRVQNYANEIEVVLQKHLIASRELSESDLVDLENTEFIDPVLAIVDPETLAGRLRELVPPAWMKSSQDRLVAAVDSYMQRSSSQTTVAGEESSSAPQRVAIVKAATELVTRLERA